MKSVISLVDFLVRSTRVNRSRIRTKAPTDFSICSILGVESDVTKSSSSSGKYNVRNYDRRHLYMQLFHQAFSTQFNIKFTLLIESIFSLF